MNLGVLLAAEGDWSASLAAYERARSLGAELPQAFVGQATALARLGRGKESRAVAREGLGRFPGNRDLARLAR